MLILTALQANLVSRVDWVNAYISRLRRLQCYMKNIKKLKIVKLHEEDYLYVIKHAGYNESFADTLRRLLKKNG